VPTKKKKKQKKKPEKHRQTNKQTNKETNKRQISGKVEKTPGMLFKPAPFVQPILNITKSHVLCQARNVFRFTSARNFYFDINLLIVAKKVNMCVGTVIQSDSRRLLFRRY